jgi:chemotaxis protein histidine kinase CheA
VNNLDLSEYIPTYHEELKTIISDSKKVLEVLSKDTSLEDMEVLRRAVHTVKSSSAMMGFLVLSEFCLSLEMMFKKILNKELLLDDDKIDLVKKSFILINEVGLQVFKPDEDKGKIPEDLFLKVKSFI